MSAILAISPEDIRNWLYSDFTTEQREVFDLCLNRTKHVWALMHKNQLLCIWGMTPGSLVSSWAHIWLYNTPAAAEHDFIFVRYSQIAIKEMQKICPVLVGYLAMDRAAESKKWLTWLGAKFLEPRGDLIPYIIGGTSG